jgi:uncharacterized protein (TIGR03435 family)
MLMLVVPATPSGMLAQALDERFQVASVRPSTTGEQMMRLSTEGNRFVAANVTVRSLIRLAFDVADFQITDGPSWMDRDRFDVLATAADALEWGSAPLHSMVRLLLEERFGLMARKETRDLPIFALTLVREDGALGPRLTRSDVDCAAVMAAAARTGGERPACGLRLTPAQLVLKGSRLDQLAAALVPFFGRRIEDRTGLTGTFDLEMSWEGPSPGGGAPGSAPSGVAPSLPTALQEQAGLKLEATRGPVPVVIVERLQQPSAN